MAKININFNNANYSIEESAFAAAFAKLQQHLSTAMSGSGATIKLGGASYNVDSTKLTTATNDFITHLGTISGSGSKVVINGTEYNVDSAKMNNAINEIHTTLGNLQSGNTGDDIYCPVYFGKTYISQDIIVDANNVMIFHWIFHENGKASVAIYIDGNLVDGNEVNVVYQGNDIILPDNVIATISSDGKIIEVTIDGVDVTLTLDESNDTSGMNEYGFYFGRKYSRISEGNKTTFILYADGSGAFYYNDTLVQSQPAGYYIYGDHQWYTIDDSSINTISADGTQFILRGGEILTIEPESGYEAFGDPALNHNSIAEGAYYANLATGTFYQTMPETVSDGDMYLYGDYLYMYYSEFDGFDANGWAVILAADDVVKITDYIPNYPITDRNQTSYDTILESINGKPIVSLLDTFNDCASLTTLPNIPRGVTSLESTCFECSGLTSVNIPDNVTSIGANTFAGCTNLTSIDVPNNVTSIGWGAFMSCTSLVTITFKGTVTAWNAIEKDTYWNEGVPATHVICSDGTVAL